LRETAEANIRSTPDIEGVNDNYNMDVEASLATEPMKRDYESLHEGAIMRHDEQPFKRVKSLLSPEMHSSVPLPQLTQDGVNPLSLLGLPGGQ
jgi:hypothetical protein